MFTETQLDLIRETARKTKNQGEVAVYYKLTGTWDQKQLNIIRYCAEECKRQRSGEMSVYHMVNAWNQAEHHAINNTQIDLSWIEWIGLLVEPDVNRNGFRTVQVGVNTNRGFKEFDHWTDIERKLTQLLELYYEGNLDPRTGGWGTSYQRLAESSEDQFYYEYEMIHPFRDGNGRSGKIIYNYLKGTLDNPVMPPNFFADEGGIP